MESEIEKRKVHSCGNSNMLYVEIGKRLRIARIELNYTQEQMAEILGISTAYYGKVERGGYSLSLEKLVIVNEKLDMDINYLLTGVGRGFSIDEVMRECPREKRYDMEHLIKYAVNLVK